MFCSALSIGSIVTHYTLLLLDLKYDLNDDGVRHTHHNSLLWREIYLPLKLPPGGGQRQ